MTPTPTPRTDAILNLLPGGHTCDPQIIADELRGPIAELERELGSPGDLPDANTTAHARINWWKDRCDDLNNELADLREGFDAEGRTAAEACCVAFKAEQVERIRQLERELDFSEKTGRQIWQANEQLERELVEARKQIADWQMLLDLEVGALRKELAAERAEHEETVSGVKLLADQYSAERALADRLAADLQQAMKHNSRLPRSSMALGDLLARHGIIKAEALDDPDGFDGYATLDALCCAFEEMMKGRDPNNLEGPPPTDEERRENARAIQALTVPERFALMFGKRLQNETDEQCDS